MNISFQIVKIILKLIGKLSLDQLEKYIVVKDANVLQHWYYETRIKL